MIAHAHHNSRKCNVRWAKYSSPQCCHIFFNCKFIGFFSISINQLAIAFNYGQSDHSPQHLKVSFHSLATNFQIWRPAFLNTDTCIYETTVRRPEVVFPQTYLISPYLSSLSSQHVAILHICSDRKLLHIPKFTNHSLKLSIILLLSGDISLNPGPEAKNIKISTINVWSIKCKTAPFTEFVTSKKHDVVAVTETWLKKWYQGSHCRYCPTRVSFSSPA